MYKLKYFKQQLIFKTVWCSTSVIVALKLVVSYSNQKNVKSGVSALSSTSSSFGTVVANGKFDTQSNGIDESLKLKALAEEEEAINKFKVNNLLLWFFTAF